MSGAALRVQLVDAPRVRAARMRVHVGTCPPALCSAWRELGVHIRTCERHGITPLACKWVQKRVLLPCGMGDGPRQTWTLYNVNK